MRLDEEGRYGRSSRNVGRDAVDTTVSCAHEVAGRGHTRERSRGARDERHYCVRRSRVVLASVADAKPARRHTQPDRDMRCRSIRWYDGGKKELATGRARGKPQNHCV